ncbi:hypothetical protein LCGC14_1837700 [marine sediment metagenome]|uniref:LmbE family protein n=1 Tax=marine sediment metagenome TaxID=412755 RepID=A0A0F9JDK2_9ZZZZ
MFEGKKILIVGAHPDDIEFGMGATLNQIKDEDVRVVVFCDTVERNTNLILNELNQSMKLYNLPFVLIKDIENMHFTENQQKIRQRLFDEKESFKPDIIFCTSKKSHNPDHKTLGESVLAVFLEQTILFYEVGRGDLEHIADLYIRVSGDDALVKQQAISQYVTQKKPYANPSLTQSILAYRGSQCNANLAESFEVERIVI